MEMSTSASSSPGDTGTGGFTCPMHPEVRQPGPGSCPKCGMALEPVAPVAAASRTEWVCPMHPEIVRDAPGSCPICGMALEPRTATVDEEENSELVDMTRRFWISVVLTIPACGGRHGGACCPGIRLRGSPPCETLGWLELVACHARRPVGRLALLRARLAVGGQPQPEHVHADRARRVRRLPLQRGRNAASRDLPAFVPCGKAERSPSTSRPRRVIVTLVLLGPGAGAAGAKPDGRRHQGAPGPRPEDRPAPPGRRLRRGRPARAGSAVATGSACGPGRRFRWTAWCSRARARWTSRWSRASRFPWRRSRATAWSGPR